MATALGIVIVKKFTYRNDPTEEWSNKYWFTGAIPASSAEWKARADALIVAEKACYAATSKVTRAYGYDDTASTANSVWSYDYTAAGQEVAGTLTSASTHRMAGDQAGYCWWKTDRKTSRGKWVYLRKFFHDGFISTGSVDGLSTETSGAYTTFATSLRTGLGLLGVIRSAAQEEQIQQSGVQGWVTTRTLKRRGRRP